MWIQLAIMATMMIISYFMQPKPQKPKPQAFNTESFPKTEDGTTKSIGFGQVKSKDFIVVYTGNFRTKAITQKGGKK